jgi:hypothetical protein
MNTDEHVYDANPISFTEDGKLNGIIDTLSPWRDGQKKKIVIARPPYGDRARCFES